MLSACLLAGCATYQAQPLPAQPPSDTLSAASVDASSMPVETLARHPFDPSDGLDADELAMLAVANSPDVQARRDAAGVQQAQAFAAGLLPDPQFGFSRDYPMPRGADVTNAFSLSLSYDLRALLMRPAARDSSRSELRMGRLEVLWAEWQAVARARTLDARILSLRAQRALLSGEVEALAGIQAPLLKALKHGQLDYSQASSGLSAHADAVNRLAEVERSLDESESALHTLIGVAPEVPLDLVGPAWPAAPTREQVDAALARVSTRRPDLLALQAGYAAQEAKVRRAVIGQFPDLQLGITRARDTGGINTIGFNIGLTLPLFDRNRGAIAESRATRTQLRHAYLARLRQTRADMDRLWHALESLTTQQAKVDRHAAKLDRARTDADRAWRDGVLGWSTWLALRSEALNADLQKIQIDQQRQQAAIALTTLLGGRWTHPPDGATQPTGNGS